VTIRATRTSIDVETGGSLVQRRWQFVRPRAAAGHTAEQYRQLFSAGGAEPRNHVFTTGLEEADSHTGPSGLYVISRQLDGS
jgi:hypothetical protein